MIKMIYKYLHKKLIECKHEYAPIVGNTEYEVCWNCGDVRFKKQVKGGK